MLTKLLLTSSLSLLIASTALTAQNTSPPRSERDEAPAVQPKIKPSASAVTAIIVKSWGDNPVWADLNADWSSYGTIPVSIDHTTLLQSDFTYADLVNANADVLILSDPAGGNQQYSSAEVAAIAKYVKAGHSILGTYLTFEYTNENNETSDNRALAPIFGLLSTPTYDYVGISNIFTKVTNACLFNRIPGPTGTSYGYPVSQVPSNGSWMGNLGGATAAAESDNYVGIISGYHKGSATAIYVSNMPEYQTLGGDDEQFLYNAITCYVVKK